MPDGVSTRSAICENWDTFRYFLTVARCGSISAAAKILNESHPTIGRKIKDLEACLATQLLDRNSGGVSLTPSGKKVFAHVERIEHETKVVRHTLLGLDDKLEGRVVVAAPEGFGTAFLLPRLGILRERFPAIDVDLLLGSTKLNLVNRDADIAVRVGDPVHPSLVGRRIGEATFALYARKDYLARRGQPHSIADLIEHDIIDGAKELRGLAQSLRLRTIAGDARRAFRSDSVVAQLEAAKNGLGIAALPRYLAIEQNDLQEVLPGALDVQEDLWVLTHRDLKEVARIRAVTDFLVGCAKQALSAQGFEKLERGVQDAACPHHLREDPVSTIHLKSCSDHLTRSEAKAV